VESILNKHPQKEHCGFEEIIRLCVFHLINALHESTEEGFVFVFTCDLLFEDRECTRVIVDGPVEKDEWNED